MESNSIVNLLPPIALSIGSVIPFLISSPPFSIPDRVKVLLSCLMVLFVWMGYWVSHIIGQWLRWPETPVPIFLGIAIGIFAFIFVKVSSVGSKDENGDDQVPVDLRSYLWLYLLGILTVTLAAGLYVAPRDWVRVQIVNEAIDTDLIKGVKRDDGSDNIVFIDSRKIPLAST